MSLEKIGRGLAMVFCKAIYSLIPSIYSVFYNLANARFLTNETVSRLSSNLYILISVVMLFTFSASLLSAIVNPDLINDKKKGVGAVFKRAIIGIMLIVLIPFAFNEAYKIQERIMSNSLIEKVIVGISYDTVECEEDEKDEDGLCPNKGGNGGQVIAGTLISAVLYPVEDGIEVDVEGAEEAYSNMVTKDISKYIKTMAKYKYINAAPKGDNAGDHEFAFEFNGLLAIIAGAATVYILLLYAMDTAVRMFKLTFFELTAPISVIAYVAAGPDMLKKWATEVGKTYVEVFIRIAGMAIYLFLMSNLDGFLSNIPGKTFFLKVVLVIGMLIFIKQLPDIVNRAFGTNWQTKGGIGGRLGSMAVVGDTAKKAWDKVKGTLATGAAIAAGGIPGALAAAPFVAGGWALGHGWKKGFKGGTPWKDTKGGRGLTTAVKTAGALFGSGNPLKGISAAGKVLEESEGGKQRQTERLQSQQNKRAQAFRDKVNAEARRLDPNLKEDVITKDKDGNIHFSNGMLAQKALQNVIANDKSLTKQQRDNARALFRENGRLETLNGLKDQKQKLLDEISNSQNALNPSASDYQARYNALESLKGNILNGNASAAEIDAKIKNLYGDGTITGVAADNMGSALSKIMNAITSSNLSADVKGKLTSKDGKEALNLSNSVLLSSITDQNKVIAGVKSDYDQSKEGATTLAKEMLNRYETASDTINNKAMFQEQGQQEGPDGKKTGYAYKYSQTTTAGPTGQTTSSTSGANSTAGNQSSNEAYNNYANGGVGGNTSSGGGLGIDPFAAQLTGQQQPASASQPSQGINENYNNYANGGVGGNTSNSDIGNQTISSQNVTINATQANVTSQNATVSGSKFEFNGTGSMDGESGEFDKAADKIVKAVNQNTEATTQTSKEEIEAEKSSSAAITQQLKSNQIIDDRNDKNLNNENNK